LIILYCFNWSGTPKGFKEYVGRMTSTSAATEGVTFKGVFMHSNEWNSVILSARLEKAIRESETGAETSHDAES